MCTCFPLVPRSFTQSTSSLLLQKWRLVTEQSGRKTTWVPRVWTKHHFVPCPGTSALALSVNIPLGSIQTLCPGTVLEYGTRWALMWTHPTLSATSTLCTRAQKWTLGPCVHTVFFFSSVAVHCFFLAAKLVFQNGVWLGEIEDSWTQLHIEYSKDERNTISCQYPVTASLSESTLNRRNHDISSPHRSMVCEQQMGQIVTLTSIRPMTRPNWPAPPVCFLWR